MTNPHTHTHTVSSIALEANINSLDFTMAVLCAVLFSLKWPKLNVNHDTLKVIIIEYMVKPSPLSPLCLLLLYADDKLVGYCAAKTFTGGCSVKLKRGCTDKDVNTLNFIHTYLHYVWKYKNR